MLGGINLKTLDEYIQQITGKKIIYFAENKNVILPKFMKNLYKWEIVQILEHKCILIKMKSERLVIKNIIIHLKMLQDALHGNPVLIFEGLNPEQRERLIEHKISFIVPQSQLYLPFVFMDFRKEEFENQMSYEKFTPSTQLVLLYILYKEGNEIFAKEIANFCKLSDMTINRAIRELLNLNVIEKIGNTRKNMSYVKTKSSIEIYNICDKYLINPVRKKFYIYKDYDNFVYKMIATNEYALSKISMLSETRIKQFAINSETYKELKKYLVLHDKYLDMPSILEIEVWKYDPLLIKCERYETVDWVSLCEVMKDSSDERVQIEIEKLLNNVLEN